MKNVKTWLGTLAALVAAVFYFISGGDLTDLNPDTPPTDGDSTTVEQPVKPTTPTDLEDYLPTSTTGVLIFHTHYSLSYSVDHKQAEWVAYELTKDKVLNAVADRDGLSFTIDPKLTVGDPVTSSDYTNTGYDRGHLAPAADMAFSQRAMEESFYTTNISPQEPGFNRGIWKSLEEQVRDWAIAYGRIYVATGPVLTSRAKARFPRSKNYVAVPQAYYKVLLYYNGTEARALAFLLKNESSDAPLLAFATTVDEVEAATGIDFFPALPDDLERRIEANADVMDWAL